MKMKIHLSLKGTLKFELSINNKSLRQLLHYITVNNVFIATSSNEAKIDTVSGRANVDESTGSAQSDESSKLEETKDLNATEVLADFAMIKSYYNITHSYFSGATNAITIQESHLGDIPNEVHVYAESAGNKT